ncbi:Hypothetical protein NGAL_HAMBI2605_54490 [Neorhizobium galegae bv. orientalis]|nr:Hypothetical protein NGAL_HAMBI2605_54490 [Neorhizobium galegae bv. orientalis]
MYERVNATESQANHNTAQANTNARNATRLVGGGLPIKSAMRDPIGKDAPSKPLSQEQSGRAWKFAEILSKATDVLGTQAEAEQWLERPAIGLDQRRPIDLLGTPAGVELVEDYLERLEYGVYA